jgi:hypothetical protein
VAVTRAAATGVTKVFPTVTSDYIQISRQDKKVRKVLVTDMVGKELLLQDINEDDTTLYTLDVNGLRSGAYILVLLDEQGKRQVSRFIKQ